MEVEVVEAGVDLKKQVLGVVEEEEQQLLPPLHNLCQINPSSPRHLNESHLLRACPSSLSWMCDHNAENETS